MRDRSSVPSPFDEVTPIEHVSAPGHVTMSEIVTASTRVVPERASAAGFRFGWPELLPALGNLLG